LQIAYFAACNVQKAKFYFDQVVRLKKVGHSKEVRYLILPGLTNSRSDIRRTKSKMLHRLIQLILAHYHLMQKNL